jgi:hypothetical protein
MPTTLEKLHEIEARKCIYDIHYCRAGVGFLFYDSSAHTHLEDWRKGLTVSGYHASFERAVDVEWERLK